MFKKIQIAILTRTDGQKGLKGMSTEGDKQRKTERKLDRKI